MLSHKEGSKLHDKIADAYRNSIDMMDEHGEYNAALLNGARQFLKDNNVTATFSRAFKNTLTETSARLITRP